MQDDDAPRDGTYAGAPRGSSPGRGAEDAVEDGSRDGADLLGLFAARICHDLISPVGAVGNGVELMRELSDGPPSPELELIGRSADAASATLRFLRLAFGAAPAEDRVAAAGFARTAEAWMAHQRPGLTWAEGGAGETSRRMARLTANLLQIAVGCLPRGGTVTVGPLPAEAGPMEIRAEGPRAAAQEGVAARLAGDPSAPPPEARDVHLLAARRHAAELGLNVTLESDGEVVVVRAG